jgi:hypothetical protein
VLPEVLLLLLEVPLVLLLLLILQTRNLQLRALEELLEQQALLQRKNLRQVVLHLILQALVVEYQEPELGYYQRKTPWWMRRGRIKSEAKRDLFDITA